MEHVCIFMCRYMELETVLWYIYNYGIMFIRMFKTNIINTQPQFQTPPMHTFILFPSVLTTISPHCVQDRTCYKQYLQDLDH